MTRRILLVTDEFEADVLEAYAFLRMRSERLAQIFLAAVEDCLIFIEEFPAASPIAWEGRKALVPLFYLLHSQ